MLSRIRKRSQNKTTLQPFGKEMSSSSPADGRTREGSKAAHVGVIGAGIAGLRCAALLIEAGFKVTILEARNRIGGRVSSTALRARGRMRRCCLANADYPCRYGRATTSATQQTCKSAFRRGGVDSDGRLTMRQGPELDLHLERRGAVHHEASQENGHTPASLER